MWSQKGPAIKLKTRIESRKTKTPTTTKQIDSILRTKVADIVTQRDDARWPADYVH